MLEPNGKISWDLKERAIFLLDHPEICDNICEVLGISPASLNCQILLLSAMIILIVCIHGRKDSLLDAF